MTTSINEIPHRHPISRGEPLLPKGQCPGCDVELRRLTHHELRMRVANAITSFERTRRGIPTDEELDAYVDHIVDAMRDVMWPPGGVHTKGLLVTPRLL